MPRNPLSKLFERRAPLRKDVEDALARLARITEQQPELAELAVTHAALLRTSFADAPPPVAWTIEPAHAAAKLEAGVPLLRGEAVPLDGSSLRTRYLALCDALIEQGTVSERTRAVEAIKQAVKRGPLDVHALALDVIAGDPQTITERAASLDLDVALAATVLRWTLIPVMEQLALKLQPFPGDLVWAHGYCPTCGAWPTLAEQRGIEQFRFGRCGLCATAWQMERLLCPFCGSRAPVDIGYLYEESDESTQRAITCERCHHYYKSVATLTPLSMPMLHVTDLLTLHLDLIALERAYAPPG